jgi:tetratricopeptide (TPR) repeat protein
VTSAYVAAWSYPRDDPAAAARCSDECAATVEQLQSQPPAVLAWALQALLWASLDAGRLDMARQAADDALAAATSANLSFAESRMALNRARIALAADDLDRAWQDAERAAVVSRRTGEPFVASVATQLLADVAERRGDRDRARDLLLSVFDEVAESHPPAALAALQERIAALSR